MTVMGYVPFTGLGHVIVLVPVARVIPAGAFVARRYRTVLVVSEATALT